MFSKLSKATTIIISSGILIGSSYLSAMYLRNELEDLLIKSLTKAMKHPSVQKKFSETSEKLLIRMLCDQENIEKVVDLSNEILENKVFFEYTMSLSRVVLESQEANQAALDFFAEISRGIIKKLVLSKK